MLNKISKILSFDPGLANLGYAQFEVDEKSNIRYLNSGSYQQKKKKLSDGQRLFQSYEFIRDLIIDFEPTHVGHELMFMRGRHSSGAGTLKIIGIIEMLSYVFGCENLFIAPPTLKKHIIGKGKASKEEMKEKVVSRIEGSIIESKLQVSHHEIDACAVGLWVYDSIIKKTT